MGQFYDYILPNKRNGTLYIGMTNDLRRRMEEHKSKRHLGFTAKYRVDKLVCFDIVENAYEAIRREKQLKAWRRKWKLELIEKNNPDWRDLSESL